MNAVAKAVRGRLGIHRAFLCPQDPTHGELLSWHGQGGKDWFCPNHRHTGRTTYSQAEVEEAAAAARKGNVA